MSKTATKSAKTVKSAAKLTEEDKRADKLNHIYNPNTDKMVKRDTSLGKKLVEAEKTGESVPKTMTETQRLILVVETLRNVIDLDDSIIKTALMNIQEELPRGFPSIWGGKHKEGRHEDYPKGVSSAYIFFTKAARPSLKAANPELSSKELITLMGKMWRETGDRDRAEYEEEAARDKERYEAEMKVFELAHPELARSKSPDNKKPTKSSAYVIFCEENRQTVKDENPELDGKSISKILANLWSKIKKDDKEVERLQALADKANKGFEERVKEYHSSPGYSKGLSKVEQAKANDPEHYELNIESGRYVLKEGWKKNVDGTFTRKEAKKGSPKAKKEVPKIKKEVPKKRAAKEVAKKQIEKIIEEEEEEEEVDCE